LQETSRIPGLPDCQPAEQLHVNVSGHRDVRTIHFERHAVAGKSAEQACLLAMKKQSFEQTYD
jgi:hypothetical protein